MSILFFKLVGMSVTAGWLILAVVIARHILGKAPKGVTYILWMLVAVRLLCPFSPESDLSLVPSELHEVSTRQVKNSFLESLGISQGLLTGIWIIGVLLLLGYSLVSFIRLYSKLSTAVRLKDDVWQSEYVKTPFILGICSPKIYVPYRISEQQLAMVVAHERSHVRQKDHIIKLAAFILLAVYWFQPMVWVAYILLCRDIEIACDERVVKNMVPRERKVYSEALLSFSVSRHSIAACPVFFGEVGVKMRIKKILSYQKSPAFVRMGAAAACALLGVCFLTNPKQPDAVSALSDQVKPESLAPGSAGKVQQAMASEMTSSQESNASDEKEETEVLLRADRTVDISVQKVEPDSTCIVASITDSKVPEGNKEQQEISNSSKDDVDQTNISKDDAGDVGNYEEEEKPAEAESSKDQIGQVGNGSSGNEAESDKTEDEDDKAETDGTEDEVDETESDGTEDADGADSETTEQDGSESIVDPEKEESSKDDTGQEDTSQDESLPGETSEDKTIERQ